jgi:hypothetical protein
MCTDMARLVRGAGATGGGGGGAGGARAFAGRGRHCTRCCRRCRGRGSSSSSSSSKSNSSSNSSRDANRRRWPAHEPCHGHRCPIAAVAVAAPAPWCRGRAGARPNGLPATQLLWSVCQCERPRGGALIGWVRVTHDSHTGPVVGARRRGGWRGGGRRGGGRPAGTRAAPVGAAGRQRGGSAAPDRPRKGTWRGRVRCACVVDSIFGYTGAQGRDTAAGWRAGRARHACAVRTQRAAALLCRRRPRGTLSGHRMHTTTDSYSMGVCMWAASP